MATSRTTYKYHFKLGNRIVHTGITQDLDRREAEHRRREGWERGHITQVGVRTTPEAAREWSKISDARANERDRNDNSPPAPPNPTCRMPSCRRAQGRRYSGVVDAVPRLVSPVCPDRTLRWQARPPRSLKTRTPRRLPVTRRH